MNEIELLKSQLEWWETYGEYISKNYAHADAEACSFADGDYED